MLAGLLRPAKHNQVNPFPLVESHPELKVYLLLVHLGVAVGRDDAAVLAVVQQAAKKFAVTVLDKAQPQLA